ncbi:MAG TPA: hypothetical protein VMS22_26620 [Candidatus Eisenbacteria bacterium]|nr:hypothetical protein [Candidatus Eisenbacteria bacterium]
MRIFQTAALVAVLLASLTLALAEETVESGATEAPPPKKWEFEARPYAWISGTFGSMTVKGNTVHLATTPSDVFHLLIHGNAFALAGYFALRYDQWSVFVDSDGGYLEETVRETIPTQLCTLTVQAKDKVKFATTDVGFGYRLGEWTLPNRERRVTLGVYAGMRYMHFGNKLNLGVGVVHGVQRAGEVKDVFDWADPMIGVQWTAPLFDAVSLDFRGDIGGFGVSSNLIWGLDGMVKVWVPWTPFSLHPYATAGYRVVAFDRGSSADNSNLQLRGPTAGVGFTF